MGYAKTLLRAGLLNGHTVRLSGSVSKATRGALAELGASIDPEDAQPRALVHDASAAFAQTGLSTALEQTWTAVSAIANDSLIPAGGGGKIVLIAPPPGAAGHVQPAPEAAEHAEAVRAGLENLARTLSTEWARYRITTTAITPGERTTDDELAALVCFLISPAGDYFSGCRFDLGCAPGR